MGLELSPEVEGAVERAVALVLEQIAELQTDAAYADAAESADARALDLERDRRHRRQARATGAR